MKDNTDDLLIKANERLSKANIGLTIERTGKALYLRGTLPSKPDSNSQCHSRQRIALSILNIRANPAGVREAENEAKKISGLLARNEFSWTPYLKSVDQLITVDQWVHKFEQDYFNRRSRNAQSQTTWECDYVAVFKRLPKSDTLSADLFLEEISKTQPDTKTRKRVVQALTQLAKFAGIECNFSKLKGTYSQKTVSPKDIPSDEQIAELIHTIDHPGWRWGYGILAAYGIRPHELFSLDLSQYPILKVVQGKTGARQVWPLYPEWADEWQLREAQVPQCTGKTNRDLGQRVGQYFRRQRLPFPPYNLRHAWAIRSIRFNIDPALAARQMGHSLSVHAEVYHQHIQEQFYAETFNLLMKQPMRPLPPAINLDRILTEK